MYHWLKYFFVLCFLIINFNCEKNAFEPAKQIITPENTFKESIVESDNQFGFNLFQTLSCEQNDKNIIISPLSISMSLGITLNGATGNTKGDIQNTLILEDENVEDINASYKYLFEFLTNRDQYVQLSINNSIWHRDDLVISDQFSAINQRFFIAEVRQFSEQDFWTVDMRESDSIDTGIPEFRNIPVNPQTSVIFINSANFSASWKYQFNETNTIKSGFYSPDGVIKTCEMMVQKNYFLYINRNSFQAIDLPFGNELFNITVFLPTDATNIDNLIQEFNEETYNRLLNTFSKDTVTLYFPKFKLQNEIILNDALSTLGMRNVFTDSAEFSDMYSNQSRQINYFVHKSQFELTEKGIEISAPPPGSGTDIFGGNNRLPDGIVMRVDKPFFFVIREIHSQAIVLVGKIIDPTF